jgi:hypothetical protein
LVGWPFWSHAGLVEQEKTGGADFTPGIGSSRVEKFSHKLLSPPERPNDERA